MNFYNIQYSPINKENHIINNKNKDQRIIINKKIKIYGSRIIKKNN